MNVVEEMAASFYINGISICDNFITHDEVTSLVEEIQHRKGNLKKAGIGNKKNYALNDDVRGDYIKWINPEDILFNKMYLNKLKPVIEIFNQRFFLGIQQSDHHISHYPPGSRYKKHVDVFEGNNSRVVSSVLYLNKNWKLADGGELLIYLENGESQKTEPLAGRLILFESHLLHEVCMNNKDRYSVTGWFKRGDM